MSGQTQNVQQLRPLSSYPNAWKEFTYPRPDLEPETIAGMDEKFEEGRKMLEQPGNPNALGGVFRSEARAGEPERTYSPWTARQPPVASNKFRIFSVCTIKTKDAGPQESGWIHCDMMMHWHLLQGLTEDQVWIHAADMDKMVEKHGQYLHGNPYKERKVVLDKEILKTMKTSRHKPEFVPFITCDGYKARLKKEFEIAKQKNQHIILLMFGHGSRVDINKRTFVREGEVQAEPNWRSTFSFGNGTQNQLHLRDFLKATGIQSHGGPKVTLITTACYAGGWLWKSDFNATAMSAAGQNFESHSWRRSTSCGRATGSMMVSGLAELLSNRMDRMTCDEDMEAAYVEMARQTFDAVLAVDRRAVNFDMTFKAYDDQWGTHWQELSGLPIDVLTNRLTSLRTHPRDPALHQGDFFNREPDVSPELRAEFLTYYEAFKRDQSNHKRLKSDIYIPFANSFKYLDIGGTDESGERTGSEGAKRSFAEMEDAVHGIRTTANLLQRIESLGDMYGASIISQDETNAASNIAFMNLLDNITARGERDYDKMVFCLNQLTYRLDHMDAATQYVDDLGISRPEGKTCQEFDFRTYHSKNQLSQNQKFQTIWSRTNGIAEQLFGFQIEEIHGMEFTKGLDYLSCALFASGLSNNDIQKRIGALIKTVDIDLHDVKDAIKDFPSVRSKRQKLADKIGKKLRDMSPVRPRRRAGNVPPPTLQTPNRGALSGPAPNLTSPPTSPTWPMSPTSPTGGFGGGGWPGSPRGGGGGEGSSGQAKPPFAPFGRFPREPGPDSYM